VNITFTQFKDDLVCIVEDNGVGRVKAKEIKSRQSGHHESFAMKAIKDRLELLNSLNPDRKGAFIFEDLKKDGNAMGTKVVITLPYKFKF